MAVVFFHSNASVTISECNLNGGIASPGGGLFVHYHSSLSSSLCISNSAFANNEATNGGGLYVEVLVNV